MFATRQRVTVILSAFLLGAFALSGCTTPSSGDEGTGQVNFYVKDAPADEFVSVFVTFTKVEVHRSGGDDDDNETEDDEDNQTSTPTVSPSPTNATEMDDDDNETDDDEEDGAAWVTLVSTTNTVDLKQFQGDARAFLGSGNISAGHYTQIRISVTDMYGLRAGNDTHVPIDLPSGKLKIVRPWTVEDGETTSLTVDFDLEKSLHQKGRGDWAFKPTLKLAIA